ncbi:MAG TPA: lactonase family protein [Streptosporangiaceae bacterium]|nr:lactonase family protein [Streptosporangiaceae bacterium]
MGPDDVIVRIGTFSDGQRPGRGIVTARVSADRSAIELADVTDAVEPSYLAPGAGGVLYAVAERHDAGGLAAFRADGDTLTPLNAVPSEGSDPCHLTLAGDGRYLAAVNYSSGSAVVYELNADGSIGARTCLVEHTGSGPVADRQESAHAHMVAPVPGDTGLLLVTDLGADAVYGYRLDPAAGTLTETARTALRPGRGPRHVAFHPERRLAYIVCELDFKLVTSEWNPDTGGLTVLDERSVVSDGQQGKDLCSAIRVSPDGRFLYAATRGADTISVFSLTPDPAAPALAGVVATGGSWPRDFALTADGLLLCANQYANTVTVFRIDPATGIPARTSATLAIPSPASILFTG